MKAIYITIALLVTIGFQSLSQVHEWSFSLGNQHDDIGFDLANDPNGNLYVTGYFKSPIDLNPGNNTSMHYPHSTSHDIFIAKYDKNGNYLWGDVLGGIGNDYAYELEISNNGDIYMSGTFSHTVDMDIRPTNSKIITTTSNNSDVFIAKYDSLFNCKWAISLDGNKSAFIDLMLLDDTGNIYISGTFYGTLDLDPSSNNFIINSNTSSYFSRDIYVAKYSSSGDFIWGFKLDGPAGMDNCSAGAFDANGNIVFIGSYSDSIDFDPGSGTSYLTSNGSKDIFVAKYSPQGDLLANFGLGSINSDFGKSIVFDDSNNMYLTGNFQNTVDFDIGAGINNLSANGSSDLFLVKYNSNWNYDWAKKLGGSDTDLGFLLKVSKGNKLILGGLYKGNLDLNPTIQNNIITSQGNQDFFMSIYSLSGDHLSGIGMGSIGNDGIFGMEIMHDGRIMLTGYFTGDSIDMDPLTPQGLLTGAGSEEILCGKYDIGEDVYHRTINICDGDSVYLNGHYRKVNGEYTDIFPNTNSNDSIIITMLKVNQSNYSKSLSICLGDSVFLNGSYRKVAGIYTDSLTNQHGCDSIISTTLSVNQPTIVNTGHNICSGDSIYLQNDFQKHAGVYFDTLTRVNGCDSVIITTLNVYQNFFSHDTLSICDGDSVLVFGNYQFLAGIYTDSSINQFGCDSVHWLSLTVNPSYYSITYDTICSGDSALFEGHYYHQSGNYISNFNTITACDSIREFKLTVMQAYYYLAQDTICEGDSILFDNSFFTHTGHYIRSYQNAYGCDSTLELHLTVHPSPAAIGINWPDTICNTSNDIILQSVPSGGVYSGDLINQPNILSPSLSTPGNYIIEYTYTNQHQCSVTITAPIALINCVNLEELPTKDNIIIFPVPSNDLIHIYSKDENISSVEIISNLGKTVYNQYKINFVKHTISHNLEAGVYYMIVLTTSGKRIIKRVLIN